MAGGKKLQSTPASAWPLRRLGVLAPRCAVRTVSQPRYRASVVPVWVASKAFTAAFG